MIVASGAYVDKDISNRFAAGKNQGNEDPTMSTRKKSSFRTLNNVFDVLLGDSLGLARSAKSTWGPESTLRSPSPIQWTAQALDWRNESAGRHRNFQIFGRGGDNRFWQVGNMDSACFILIALGYYLE